MPKVTQKKKSSGGKYEYRCQRCSEVIQPGETYYEWTFRYGGSQRQHTVHGYPRQSQLTQSKMSQVYSAMEDLEDWQYSGENLEKENTSDEDFYAAFDEIIGDAEAALSEAKDAAQEIADEYEEAIETMPASEDQNRERIDAIEGWIYELDSAEGELDSVDREAALEEDDPVQVFAEGVQEVVSNAAGSFSY